MTAPTLDLTDQIRRAYAAADAAGQPRPGRPALIALTGAPERQVRRAMREAGHLAPVPDVQSSAALDTIPVQASRDLDTAGHPGASSADRSDVQASSDAHDGTVQAATAERLDVHPAPAGHPAAGDLDTWTTQLDADASSDLDGPFAVDMLIAQQDTRLDNSRDAAVSSGASTALDSQVNGLDAPAGHLDNDVDVPASSGPVQAAGDSVQADQPVTAPRVDWTPLDAGPGQLDTTTSSDLDTPASSAANAGQSSDVQASSAVQLDAQDPAAPATLDTPAERLDAPVSSGLDGWTPRVQRLAARAAEARQLRALHVQSDIRAVILMRQRRVWTLLATLALVGALASTAVNVQRFAAGDAPAWTVPWIMGWLVDPAFSILLVGIVVARGNLSAVRHKVADWVVSAVEVGLLAAVLVMNVVPEIEAPTVDAGQVVLHALLPLLGFGAALSITRVQDKFAAAIDNLYREVSR